MNAEWAERGRPSWFWALPGAESHLLNVSCHQHAAEVAASCKGWCLHVRAADYSLLRRVHRIKATVDFVWLCVFVFWDGKKKWMTSVELFSTQVASDVCTHVHMQPLTLTSDTGDRPANSGLGVFNQLLSRHQSALGAWAPQKLLSESISNVTLQILVSLSSWLQPGWFSPTVVNLNIAVLTQAAAQLSAFCPLSITSALATVLPCSSNHISSLRMNSCIHSFIYLHVWIVFFQGIYLFSKPQKELFLLPRLVILNASQLYVCFLLLCFCYVEMTGRRNALRLDRLGLAGSAALCFPPLRWHHRCDSALARASQGDRVRAADAVSVYLTALVFASSNEETGVVGGHKCACVWEGAGGVC